MRPRQFLVVPVVFLINSMTVGLAQTGAKLHDIDGFIAKGLFSELDPELMKHRLTQGEIEKAGLNGELTDIDTILAWMAKCEKMGSQVEEPLEVRGKMAIFLPPNSMGDEAFTTCFYAFSFNGLGFSGLAADLLLVRPEKHPRLVRLGRPWNREQVLSTRLYRLGYLKPDPIMRQYRDKLGNSGGHAVFERRSNILIVTDTPKALQALQGYIDSQTLEAMGLPAGHAQVPDEGPRAPSLGAIASRETIHFYLMAFARSNQFPLAAAEQKNLVAKYYPEADLWTDETGYKALAQEYQRLGEYVRLARETGGEGWDEPVPGRTLSPREQQRLTIRFGLAGPVPGKGAATKSKKTARKR
jgi:hypothetical protein